MDVFGTFFFDVVVFLFDIDTIQKGNHSFYSHLLLSAGNHLLLASGHIKAAFSMTISNQLDIE